MRKGVKTLLGVAVAVGTLAGCSNDPLTKDADEAVFFFTNPSTATIAADTVGIPVTARVMNRYNAPTGDAVTATPCDSKLTVAKDPLRTELESPERFIVKGVAAGASCIVVTGGGITDTVDVLVGPNSVSISAPADLGSGETAPVTIAALNGVGQPLAGFATSDLRVTSSNSAVVFVDTTTNTLQGRAPGTATITVTNRAGTGAIKTATATVTVSAGTFTGTVSPSDISKGQMVTLTAGAIAFDADTKVTIAGVDQSILSNTPTTITFVLPLSTIGNPTELVVSNLGPDQVASKKAITVNNTNYIATHGATDDVAGDDSFATARTLSIPGVAYGTVTPTDHDDYFKIVPSATGTYDLKLDWPGTADVDVLLVNSSGAFVGSQSCASSNQPESCTTASLTAGTTYYVVVEFYDGPAATPQPYVLTIKKH
jgi:hypothetical protein